MRENRRTPRFLLLFGIWIVGCSEPEPVPSVDAVATDSAVQATDHESGGAEDSEVEAAEPFQVFGLSTPRDAAATTITPVWLINGTRETLVVSAVAGAATVIVDTVRRSDSVLVRLETPADSVLLSARTTEGVNVGRVALSMDAETKRAAFPR